MWTSRGWGSTTQTTDEVDILARSVSLNANMWANQATIITGDNLINYNDKSVTSRSTGEKTGFSLDVAAIGGMYANRIRLIGTEKGLGVNLSGKVSGTESMMLDTQGNLVNKVSLSSKQLSVNANNITNTGELLGDNITLTANVQDTDILNLTVTGLLKNEGIISSDSGMIVSAASLHNKTGAELQADGELTLTITGGIENHGIVAGGNGTVSAEYLKNRSDGKVQGGQGTLTIEVDGHIDNQGELFSTDKLKIGVGSLTNALNANIQATDRLGLKVTSSLINKGIIFLR